MFQVLIVEDESRIREMMEKIIPWKAIGFQVTASFASGEEALDYAINNPVDVIFTDIQLIHMSGLELIRRVQAQKKQIISVILTSYEKFEYAKEAIELNVMCYLTKPLNLLKTKEVFMDIRNRLDSNRQEELNKRKFYEYKKEKVLRKFLRGYALEPEEQIFVPENFKEFVIIKVQLPHKFPIDLDELHRKLAGEDMHIVVVEEFSRITVGLFFKSSFSGEKLNNVLHQLYNETKKAVMGVSKVYSQAEYINQAYIEADIALEHYCYVKKETIYYEAVESIQYVEGTQVEFFKHISQEVSDFISKNQLEKVAPYLLKQVQNSDFNDLNQIRNIYLEVLFFIQSKLKNDLQEGYFVNNISMIQQILGCNSHQEVNRKLEQYLAFVKESLLSKNEKIDSKVIKVLLEYIDKHYFKEISLQDLSREVYLHPVYLSKVFKQEVGKNFVDYLTEVRIQKARIFLKDVSLKVNDVCSMVGYQSSKHFSKQFKRLTGVTPTEYRNSNTY